jgi:hypothetical protein
MTIAAGFVCDDGIVLGADTQYSNSNIKVSRTKLWQSERRDCVIAAAGDEVLMKEAAETILAQLHEGIALDDVKEIIEHTMEALYTQHIDRSSDPSYGLQVLVAVNAADGSALFKQSRWAVTSVEHSACIGTGDAFGNYVADRFWGTKKRPIIAGCIVAAHLLQLAKRYEPWCGFDSDIFVLPNPGHAYRLADRNIRNIEQFFDSVDAVLRPLLLVIPDSRYSSDAVEDRLQRFCEGIRATRPFPFDLTIALTGVAAITMTAHLSAEVIAPAPKQPEDGS